MPFPSPGDLLGPRVEPAFLASPALTGRFFTISSPGNFLKAMNFFELSYAKIKIVYEILIWPRNSFRVFHKMLWKLLGQSNRFEKFCKLLNTLSLVMLNS